MARKPPAAIMAVAAALALAGCGTSGPPGDRAGDPGASAPVRVAVSGAPPLRVELADEPIEHTRGLMGRDRLPPRAGMLFVYDEPSTLQFWMKGTRIPLDVLWIRGGRVVGIDTMRPEPGVDDDDLRLYPSPGPVDAALEVNAGWALRHGVRAGARIRRLDR